MSGSLSVDRDYTAEVLRKGIHLASLSIPVVYAYVSRNTALMILVPLLAVFALSDLARLLHPATARLYNRFFGFLLRKHERSDRGRQLTGATYVLLSAVLCVALFPKVIVITAFAILIVSDSAAALIGRRIGRTPFLKKSAEGTAAFFVTAVLVVLLSPKITYAFSEYAIGIAAALVGTIVEASGIGIDDNLTIPLSIGGAMWGLYAAFLPEVNIFLLDALR
jgi:dolichol kinase